MEIGHLNQKASRPLVLFVFGCIIITTGLLYIMQKSVAVADNISSVTKVKIVTN